MASAIAWRSHLKEPSLRRVSANNPRHKADYKRQASLTGGGSSPVHGVNPHDPEAEITTMKDDRTALAYKAEHAVGMDRRDCGGDRVWRSCRRYHLVAEMLPAAGEAVAEQMAEPTTHCKFTVDTKGLE